MLTRTLCPLTCLTWSFIRREGMIFRPPVRFLVAPILYHIRDLGWESTIYGLTVSLISHWLLLKSYLRGSNDGGILIAELGVLLDVLDEAGQGVPVDPAGGGEQILVAQHPLGWKQEEINNLLRVEDSIGRLVG